MLKIMPFVEVRSFTRFCFETAIFTHKHDVSYHKLDLFLKLLTKTRSFLLPQQLAMENPVDFTSREGVFPEKSVPLRAALAQPVEFAVQVNPKGQPQAWLKSWMFLMEVKKG